MTKEEAAKEYFGEAFNYAMTETLDKYYESLELYAQEFHRDKMEKVMEKVDGMIKESHDYAAYAPTMDSARLHMHKKLRLEEFLQFLTKEE